MACADLASGASPKLPAHEQPIADFRKLLELNVVAPTIVSQVSYQPAFAAHIVKRLVLLVIDIGMLRRPVLL